MADKALLVGINEYRSFNPLRGCVRDVENMRLHLTEVFGFDARNVKTLTDRAATKDETLRQMKWLIKDAKQGDRLLFHFSGHGSYVADRDGDEDDGRDEILCFHDMDFDDPRTYLLDDELRRWTEALPEGAELVVVLDSCHSGTATRALLTPIPGKPYESMAVRIDAEATFRRAAEARGIGNRTLELAEAADAALDPRHEDLVVVRFIDPPAEVKERVMVHERKVARRKPERAMNHLLLAACRDDQTAADATLGGQPNGAFTFFLCKALRDSGAGTDRRTLIDAVRKEVRTARFSQVPQLEPEETNGPLYSGVVPGRPSRPVEGGVEPSTEGIGLGQLTGLLDRISRLAPEAQAAAIRMLEGRLGRPADAASRAPGARHLVYVHGICKHDAGFSDGWWQSLRPFTSVFGVGDRAVTRHETLWSDLVNARGPTEALEREMDGRAEWAARVRGALEERAAAEVLETDEGSNARVLAFESLQPRECVERGESSARGLSVPGLKCVDDFAVYMFNDGVRAKIIARFTEVVRPLLASGAELDIVSHSWGTVVAYEGLRALEAEGFAARQVRSFFTVGAALAIFLVRTRLRLANRDGRKPAMIRRWINLNAKGDPVGGRLRANFQTDSEALELDNLGCGRFDASCAHGSYFKAANLAVNRDLFAGVINAS